MTGAWRVETYGVVDSTQDIVRLRADSGEREGLVVQALSQTGGRGRLGNVWDSPPGNLYLSVLLRPDVPAMRMGELAFVCAVAAGEALEPFVNGRNLLLKWPNDILIDGLKVAGILIETALTGDRPDYAIVGIGVNMDAPPSGAAGLASPSGQGSFSAAECVRNAILERLSVWLDLWGEEGFSPVRAAWLSRAGGLGQPIRVRRAGGVTEGVFQGIDANGALILKRDSGALERICSGEILTSVREMP